MQIFCFGDSITWGSWEKDGGWVDRLKRSFYEYVESNQDAWVEVYNLGIPGNRTDDLIKRFVFETSQRIDEENNGRIFIFAFGANDAAFDSIQNAFRCPPDRFEKNLRTCVEAAKKFSGKIFLTTITPVIGEKQLRPERIRKNEYIEMYNLLLKKIASEERLGIIDAHTAFVHQDMSRLLGEDGLHPNAKGHELIFTLTKKELAIS